MHVAIAHAAAPEYNRVIQKVAIAVGAFPQLLEKISQRFDVIRIQFRVILHLFRIVAVVRHRVMRLGQANLGVWAIHVFASHHQRADTCDVRLERQHLQVEHQLDVLLEGFGHAGRLLGQCKVPVGRFGLRDALFDVANGVEILAELGAVTRAESPAKRRDLLREAVEDAAIFSGSSQALFGRGSDAEHPLQDEARIGLRRERVRRALP